MVSMPSLQYLVFKNEKKFGFVIVSTDVINKISEYRQINGTKNESGGILLGYRREPHIEIVSFTTPSDEDIQSPIAFIRKEKSHQIDSDNKWLKSNKQIDYVGEWHTHPQTTAIPSIIDKTNWGKKFAGQKDKKMIGIILGMKNDWYGEICSKPISKLIRID